MLSNLTFQLAQGIWNPAKENHSWVVVEEFETLAAARLAIDEAVADNLGLARLERVTPDHRRSYSGPPLAVIQINSKVIERLTANISEIA